MSARTDAATKKLTRTGRIVDGLKKKVLGLAAAWISFRGITAVGSGISESLDRIDRFAKKSTALNLPIAEIQAFSQAANIAGADFETVIKALAVMQRRGSEAAVGLESAKRPLEDLGINIEAFNNLGTTDQFLAIADGLEKVATQNDKARIASELFGRAGVELLPFLKDGNNALKAANETLDKYGLKLSQLDGRTVETINDRWTTLRLVLSGIYDVLAIRLSPALAALGLLLTKTFSGAIGLVRKLSDFMGTAAGKAVLWVSATAAMVVLIPTVIGALKLLVTGFKALIGAQTISQALMGPAGWINLGLAAAAATGGIALANSALEKFNDEIVAAQGDADKLAEVAEKIRESTEGSLDTLDADGEFEKIADAIESRADAMKQALRTPLEEFRDKLIEINELSEQLGPDFTNRAQLAARDAFVRSLPQKIETSKPVQIIANVSAGQRGSQEELSRLFKVKIDDSVDVQEEILDAEEEGNRVLGDILEELRKPTSTVPGNLG